MTTLPLPTAPPPAPRKAPRAKGAPVLGALPAILRDPPGALARIAREHPGAVVRIPFGPVDTYFLSHPSHVQHVLQDKCRNYDKGAGMWRPLQRLLGQGLVTADGDVWIRNRRRLQPLFSAQSLASFTQVMIDVIDRALKELERTADTPVEIGREMTAITQSIIFETFFGTHVESKKMIDDLGAHLAYALRAINLRMMLYFLPERFPLPGDERLRRSILAIDDGLMRLFRDRDVKEQPGKDLLSLMRHATDPESGERLTEREIRDELVTLWVAGNETTAVALSWVWLLLDKHPEVQARARAEVEEVLGSRLPTAEDLERMPYGKRVIREAMRLYSPSWIIPRQAIADDVVDGYSIPAGATVLLSQFSTHRDPAFWERPEAFEPERFSPERSEGRHRFAYFPFSGGPRVCIGMAFGMIEAQLLLAMMLQRFRLRFPPGQELRYQAASTLRPRGKWMAQLERISR